MVIGTPWQCVSSATIVLRAAVFFFFFSSRRRHTRLQGDWSSDVCSSDLSPLVHRIESTDPKQIMPPPESHKTLKAEEIALLRRWVKEGAPYQEHWAYHEIGRASCRERV